MPYCFNHLTYYYKCAYTKEQIPAVLTFRVFLLLKSMFSPILKALCLDF